MCLFMLHVFVHVRFFVHMCVLVKEWASRPGASCGQFSAVLQSSSGQTGSGQDGPGSVCCWWSAGRSIRWSLGSSSDSGSAGATPAQQVCDSGRPWSSVNAWCQNLSPHQSPVFSLYSKTISSCLTRLYQSVAQLIRWTDQVMLQSGAQDKDSKASATVAVKTVLDGVKVNMGNGLMFASTSTSFMCPFNLLSVPFISICPVPTFFQITTYFLCLSCIFFSPFYPLSFMSPFLPSSVLFI